MVGVWVTRGATKPTPDPHANRQPPRRAVDPARVRGVVVALGSARPAARVRPTASGEFAGRPGPPTRAAMRRQPTRVAPWRVRGVGVAGRPLGQRKKKTARVEILSRFESRPRPRRARAAPAPRRVRPRPPSGGCWRRRVAVGGWLMRGTRGGVRKRRARRRGARAHAAADRGPSAPPVPPAAVAPDPAADSPTRERVVGGRDRLGKLFFFSRECWQDVALRAGRGPGPNPNPKGKPGVERALRSPSPQRRASARTNCTRTRAP